jgi:hypothetical protein
MSAVRSVISGTQIRAFVADAQQQIDEHHQTQFPSMPRPFLVTVGGRRYVRLIRRDPSGTYGTPTVSRTYAFLDRTTGAVLRPAGSALDAGPDPIPRGHLFDPLDPSHGRAALTPAGLRRLDDPILDPGMISALRRKYAPATISAKIQPPIASETAEAVADSSWLIMTHHGLPYPSARYPQVVEARASEPGRYISWSGIIGSSGSLLPGYAARPPKNAREREVAQEEAARHRQQTAGSFSRWAEREGPVVKWGNTVISQVGVFHGQSFRETFATEAEAIERERQALANEAIGEGRAPVAVSREVLKR